MDRMRSSPLAHLLPLHIVPVCCSLPRFEVHILTEDDVMETLLSFALQNRRMISNEMQPEFFQVGPSSGFGPKAATFLHVMLFIFTGSSGKHHT